MIKECPTCKRTYPNSDIAFCLADGALLSAPFDPGREARGAGGTATNNEQWIRDNEGPKPELPPTVASKTVFAESPHQGEREPSQPIVNAIQPEVSAASSGRRNSRGLLIVVGVGAVLVAGTLGYRLGGAPSALGFLVIAILALIVGRAIQRGAKRGQS